MRLLTTILVAAVSLWLVGFVGFLNRIDARHETPMSPADGVAVFTGEPERVTIGLSLLEDAKGARLLISGVNPATTRQHIAAHWQGSMAIFDCCVDLGEEAQSTKGNATELRDWAATHGIEKVILVTSDYHMPRALLEARRKSDLDIIPYPVASALSARRPLPQDLHHWRRLAGEYNKYIAVSLSRLTLS